MVNPVAVREVNPMEETPAEPSPPREEGSFSREFSMDQLKQVLEFASASVEEAAKCLAGILMLDNYKIIPRNAFVLDYCLGIIMFSQEAGFSLEQTIHLYSLGLDLLDIVERDGSFEEAEAAFQEKMMFLSCRECGNENPPFSCYLDVQKATEYFTSTLFQHYYLYCYCFNKEHCHVTTSETVKIEAALVRPLSESLITEEYEADLAAKAAARTQAEAEEKARQEAAAQAEAEALAAAEALRLEEERKRKPQTLEEAVEFVVRDKMEVAKKQLAEEYNHHEKALVDKFQQLAPTEQTKPEAPKKKK